MALLLATALVLRLRSPRGALALCLAWSGLVFVLTFYDPTGGFRAAAMAEGYIARPTILIALVFALCAGMILYTGRPDPD